MKLPGMELIDPREYRAFCFRGEGRANFVISAKNTKTGLRIVWRFAKARKSGMITVKAKSEMVNEYMERMVVPFFDKKYLVSPKIIEMKIDDVYQLAKIPSLPPNLKLELFDELLSLPDEFSFLPLSKVAHGISKLSALEMLDATRIPKQMTSYIGSTITIEIKPKQGFFQNHPSIDIPFCNNCILQLEKCGSDHYDEMYDFCPLDLFSGCLPKMKSSLEALIKVPHRNLRLFVDGNLVHSDETALDCMLFNSTLFPNEQATVDDLLTALCIVLAGCEDSADFSLRDHSVLGEILAAQRIDPVGIIRAHQIYKSLPTSIQKDLLDKSRLPVRGLEALEATDDRALLERYLLAATMKDCSIMVSLRIVPSVNQSQRSDDAQIVRLRNGLSFAFSVKIVDLDPKSPKNLVNAYARFMAGVKIIRLEAVARKPCVDHV